MQETNSEKLQTQTDNIKFWLLAGLAFLLTVLFTFMNLEEFVKVGVLKQTGGYPFGEEGPVPWYYKTADLYAKMNLFFGLLFLATLGFAIWTTAKKKKMALFITFLTTIFLIVIQIVNGAAD